MFIWLQLICGCQSSFGDKFITFKMWRIRKILVSLLLIFPSITEGANIWNQLVSFKGKLQASDYTYSQGEPQQNSQLAFRHYTLTLYSDQSMQFLLEADEGISETKFPGSVTSTKECHQLMTNSYKLTARAHAELTGTLSSETKWGVTWKYRIKIQQMGIDLQREQVRYEYWLICLLIVFGVGGVLIFSISDKKRNKILYNLKKRSHPAVLLGIIYKLLLVAICFLLFGYGSVFQIAIWSILLLYGVYLFCLSPSILHVMYLSSAAQKSLQQSEWYKSKSNGMKSLIVLGTLFLFVLAFFVTIMIQKGIIFFYIFSINTIAIYAYSVRIMKFAYGPLIVYDILLTFIISMFFLYFPVAGFSLVSYKQMILFWNFFVFVFIFGMILMKKSIKIEMVEESRVQIEAESIQQQRPHQSLEIMED